MKILLSITCFLLISLTNSAQVGIGTQTPNQSALLDLTSTTKGLLLPRLTCQQITGVLSPEEGLVVYNLNTHKVNVFNGTAWTNLDGSGSAQVPASLSTSNITSISAKLDWLPVAGSTGFNVRYRKLGAQTWITGNSIAVGFTADMLQDYSDYEWQVRANTTCGGLSVYAPADTFRTAVATYKQVVSGTGFVPNIVVIKRGDFVRWEGSLSFHPIVSGTPGNPDGNFASPLAGTLFEHRFMIEGSYAYYCGFHGVTGFVTVE
ncbi:MAG: hypothetical protein V4717_24325 [Bacteroidota bacterium]